MSLRLQKYLAEAGVGSRRGCEDLIREGRVIVDGQVATIGSSVEPGSQSILVDGRSVACESKEYWLLNKPAGVLSAAVDARGRPTVVDCVPAAVRVFPVGRLDLESTGLLLLTNDGELTARLLHPRYHVEKEYLVVVRGAVGTEELRPLRGGMLLEDGVTAPAVVEVLKTDRQAGKTSTTLRITLHEGRKRQVRRMLEAVGHRVLTLNRTRFAGLTDSALPLGHARPLSPQEVRSLRNAAGLR